jgi:hypothetical protein
MFQKILCANSSTVLSYKQIKAKEFHIRNENEINFENNFIEAAGWSLRLGLTAVYPEVGISMYELK